MISRRPTTSIAFGRIVRRCRLSRGWTQENLAFESNLDRTYVTALEAGQSSPTLNTMHSVAEALGLSLEELGRRLDAELTERKQDSSNAADPSP